MIKPTNPVHRVKELNDRIAVLRAKMKPFYDALQLLSSSEEDYNVEQLESVPAFRTIWVEWTEARNELDRLLLRLALAYESCPVEM